MRLGGPVFIQSNTPEEFVTAHLKKGFRAAYCPADIKAGDTALINAYKTQLNIADIVLAEVGAWCNPLSRNAAEAKKAQEYVISRLALADEQEAKCCVNIVGSWHDSHWYAPAADNFKRDFFIYAVEVWRKIIDAVKPKCTKMTFEIMPYSFLDSAEEYCRFLFTLYRKEAGVHFDPANCINSPRLYFDNASFFRRQLDLFPDQIMSIHLKDLHLHTDLPNVWLEEVPLGRGGLDISSLIREINKLPEDTPVMLEHLPDEEAYDRAADFVRLHAKQ